MLIKLLFNSLDVRYVDAFGLLGFFLWVFFSPVVIFDCSLDEFFWTAGFVVVQLRCDAFLQFCPFRLKQCCLLGQIRQ